METLSSLGFKKHHGNERTKVSLIILYNTNWYTY